MKLGESLLVNSFEEAQPFYARLSINLKQGVTELIKSANIPIFSVNTRVKGLESFLEKIQRKGYADPFNEMEDICGVRVICFYPSDVEKIVSLLSNELDVKEAEDKEKKLKPNEFGYRSHHMVVKCPELWLHAPNYRGLDNLPAEIQIRTILSHTWAEIEHKLNYKKSGGVSQESERRFFSLAARIEDVEKDFQKLRDDIYSSRQKMKNDLNKKEEFDTTIELNFFSLSLFLDRHFPTRREVKSEQLFTTELLKHATHSGVGFREMHKAILQLDSFKTEITSDLQLEGYGTVGEGAGLLVLFMDIFSRNFFEKRNPSSQPWKNVVSKWQIELETFK